MKILSCLIILTLFSFHVEADGGVSLNEAVNQVQSEGRVLSAKTNNGWHEIKILTPSGTVKTISKKADNPQVNIKPDRPEYYNKGGQSMRDHKQNRAIPSRFNNQRKSLKLNQRQLNRSQLDLQPMSKDRKAKSRKPNNKKDKGH